MGKIQFKHTFKLSTLSLLITISTLIHQSASAKNELLVEEGAFYSEWIDENWGELSLQRAFHSRSLFKGVFGLGWCSTLDIELRRSGTQSELTTCFKKPVIVSPSFDKTAKLTKILWDNFTYEFNQKGQLMGIQKAPLKIKIQRDPQGRITNIEYQRRHLRTQLPVKYNKNDNITKIGTNTYQYNEVRQLSAVKNSWNSKFTYRYNFYNNLVEIKGPGKYLEQIEYDDDLDVVTKWSDKSGCTTQADWIEKGSTPSADLVYLEPEIKKECVL